VSEQLVTGEAVPVDVRLARLPSRALALGLDLLVQFAALTGMLFVAGTVVSQAEDAVAAALALVLVVAVLVGYPVTMETLTRGRTLGKLAFGLRVVRDDGGPIGFRQALARGLFAVFPDIWVSGGSAALITALLNRRGKRLGDIVAGTVVVQERLPLPPARPVDMPPPLAGWASGIDLSRLSDDLALAARQFLTRAAQLDAPAREELGARLAAAVAAVVQPRPPPGTPAVAYLAAVLAERRRREDQRLRTNGRAPGAAAPGDAQPTPRRTPRPLTPARPPPDERAPPRPGPFEPPT
jgi:uncharacterized RDD family membrane protein YckC